MRLSSLRECFKSRPNQRNATVRDICGLTQYYYKDLKISLRIQYGQQIQYNTIPEDKRHDRDVALAVDYSQELARAKVQQPKKQRQKAVVGNLKAASKSLTSYIPDIGISVTVVT